MKSRGIFTEFAASALDKFAFMVAAIGASQTTDLGSRGILPNRDEYQLMITDESQRAIDAIRAFLEVMENNEAAFALELDSDNPRPHQFIGVEQTKRTIERLKPENIREGDKELLGKFQGTIPKRRLFQFLIESPPEIIIGKIGPEVEDPIEINQILEKPARIQVHTKQVGTSRPTYRLSHVEEVKE